MTELVKYEAPVLATVSADDLEGINLSFDRVKNPAGGGLTFEVPGDDPTRPDAVAKLVGVIVHSHPSSTLYLDEAVGDDNKPDAWSSDGKTQVVPAETIEKCRKRGLPIPSTDLATCHYNSWGSSPKGGKGKWTQNKVTLYLLRSGDMLPLVLNVTPTSINAFGDYKLKRVLTKGLKLDQVVTSIGLEKAQANGYKFSKFTFALEGPLPDTIVDDVRNVGDLVRDYLADRENGQVEAAPTASPSDLNTNDDFAASMSSNFDAVEIDAPIV